MVGDARYQIVFVWLVLSISGSPAALAAVLVATALPRGVLLLIGGAVTDRFSPRTVLLISHLVCGASLAVLTALAASGGLQLWQFYEIGILFGIADAFFWASKRWHRPVPRTGDRLATSKRPDRCREAGQ